MAALHHYPLCPNSRFARLALAEMGVAVDLVDERPWDRREAFLALDPAGQTPVFVDGATIAPGALVIAEYLDETRGPRSERRLMPADPAARVEVRRLLAWFTMKFHDEVSGPLVTQKIYRRFLPASAGGGAPDMSAIRAARTNVRAHLRMIGTLSQHRNFLAGDDMTFADLAAAAHISCVDYLGDIPWTEDEAAKTWYARIKSRPSFRPLLADRVAGMAPTDHYADLDF